MVCTDVLGRIEREVIKECSPTLAGLKTGSLFNYRYDNIPEYHQEDCSHNKLLISIVIYLYSAFGDRTFRYFLLDYHTVP